MRNRPLIIYDIDPYIPEVKQLYFTGICDYGPIDKFKELVEANLRYKIDRYHFFKMIIEEMAFRYMETQNDRTKTSNDS